MSAAAAGLYFLVRVTLTFTGEATAYERISGPEPITQCLTEQLQQTVSSVAPRGEVFVFYCEREFK